MDFEVEDISPVKKKVSIKVGADEVDAAIKGTAALYRTNVQMDGFRKGKAPIAVVEKRFHDRIYQEAHDDLINVHINDALGKIDARPLGGIVISGEEKPLKKGEPYEYALEFEVLPEFELPPYEGMEVEEQEIEVRPEIVDRMLARIQRERSTLVPAEGNGPATDGQVANIDFETFVDGKPFEQFKAVNFDLELGRGSALPEFEEFVKTIPVEHTAEKVIHFPADFIAAELADKDATMKVTVHAVKERQLPELNDEFAAKLGQKDMDAVRADLAEAYKKGMRQLYKGASQKKLLDALVRQTEFELPDGMVDTEAKFLVGDQIATAREKGQRLINGPEDVDKLRQEAEPRARERAREKIILLTIAKKENLEVPARDVELEIYRNALQMGKNVEEYYKEMRDTGMIFLLRDTMLCDKAMDLVYERANVKLVAPEPGDATGADVGTEAGADAGAAG